MKIVVIGGTGLIGSKLVAKLREQGQNPVAASPASGVNSVTGEGLPEVMQGARVVIDVSNSPDWEDEAVMHFFQTSTRNLLAAEANAGVGHHVALSVVGTDRLLESGYFRAKLAQEKLIQASNVPYSIVRATQFMEFVDAIAQFGTVGQTVRMPTALIQPIAAEDVAAALADVALSNPTNRITDLAGPEPFQMDELIRQRLAEQGDPREVVTDETARYYGLLLSKGSLVPEGEARLAPTRFADWMRRNAGKSQAVSV